MTAFCINPGRCAFCTASRMGVETQINKRGHIMKYFDTESGEFVSLDELRAAYEESDMKADGIGFLRWLDEITGKNGTIEKVPETL